MENLCVKIPHSVSECVYYDQWKIGAEGGKKKNERSCICICIYMPSVYLFDSIRFDSIRFDSIGIISIRFHSIWFDSFLLYSIQHLCKDVRIALSPSFHFPCTSAKIDMFLFLFFFPTFSVLDLFTSFLYPYFFFLQLHKDSA